MSEIICKKGNYYITKNSADKEQYSVCIENVTNSECDSVFRELWVAKVRLNYLYENKIESTDKQWLNGERFFR